MYTREEENIYFKMTKLQTEVADLRDELPHTDTFIGFMFATTASPVASANTQDILRRRRRELI